MIDTDQEKVYDKTASQCEEEEVAEEDEEEINLQINEYIFVIDRSGSMSGAPI